MVENGNGVKLGRPPREDRGEIVRNNGFTVSQWEWLEREAKSKDMDTMKFIRTIVQWWIDNVEASRSGPIATAEEDNKYDKLVSNQKSNRKSKRSNKK